MQLQLINELFLPQASRYYTDLTEGKNRFEIDNITYSHY